MPGYKSVFVEATAVRASALWTNVGGAATLATAVADSSDVTYMDQAGTVDWALSFVDFDMGDIALPAGAKIDSVHSHLRAREMTSAPFRTYPQNWLTIIQHLGRANRMYAAPDRLNADPATFTDYQWGHWSTPDGKEWTQADVNNLIMSVAVSQQNSAGYGNLNWEVARMRAEVWYNERPAVTVSAPTGTIATVRPTVTYAFSDPEQDPQVAHHIKVASAAQYGAAGFSWDTSPVTWDSGEEFAGFGQRTIGVNLVNGTTYRVAVKVRQDWPRSRHESTWVTSEFTVSITPPATPTLTVTPQPVSTLGPRVQLAIGGATAANTTTVEYSDDAGVTWTLHPRQSSLTGATSYTVHDYELPQGTSRRYRVRQVNAAQTAASAYATSTDQTLTFTAWWLKDVQDPARNISLRLEPPLQVGRVEDQGVFWPLGRSTPVVVAGDLRSRAGQFTANFTTDAAWTSFETIRGGQRPLLLQFAHGGQMWVRLGGDAEEETVFRRGATTTALRRLTVPFYEVDAL